jgi:hypothetical protein
MTSQRTLLAAARQRLHSHNDKNGQRLLKRSIRISSIMSVRQTHPLTPRLLVTCCPRVSVLSDQLKSDMSIASAAPVFQGQRPVDSIAKHLARGGRINVSCRQTDHSLVHWVLLDDASLNKSLQMLKRLLALANGVSADARDDEGTTALMMSCDMPECQDHCKVLIDAGADVHAQRPQVVQLSSAHCLLQRLSFSGEAAAQSWSGCQRLGSQSYTAFNF